MSEATEEQIAAGIKTYRARCLDHGIEWRTSEPMHCPTCQDEYQAVPKRIEPEESVSIPADPPISDDNIKQLLEEPVTVVDRGPTVDESGTPTVEVRRPKKTSNR